MRMLTENLGLKLVSVAIAAALWWFVAGESQIAMSVPASVQYRNVPADLELNADTIDRLFLKVRGPATRITSNALAQTALVLDLAGAEGPGEHSFNISASNLTLPVGVSLVRVIPSQVKVRLEKRITKDVPVEVRFAGPPPRGYRVASQTVAPPAVRLVGPESRLESVTSVLTDPVDLASKIGTAEFRVNAALPDGHVRFENDTPAVAVSVVVEKIP